MTAARSMKVMFLITRPENRDGGAQDQDGEDEGANRVGDQIRIVFLL